MRIYLDASALNRPFDDQRLARNRMEAEAVLAILEWVETEKIELISSAALVYENLRSPLAERGRAEWFVTCDDRILRRARRGKLSVRLTIGTPIGFVATRKKSNGQS